MPRTYNNGMPRSYNNDGNGRICGKNNTSWIDAELVMIMVRRSIPMPSPSCG